MQTGLDTGVALTSLAGENSQCTSCARSALLVPVFACCSSLHMLLWCVSVPGLVPACVLSHLVLDEVMLRKMLLRVEIFLLNVRAAPGYLICAENTFDFITRACSLFSKPRMIGP